MNKYFLFSAIDRCAPCRALVFELDKSIPNWKEYINYVDIDNSTEEEINIATKLGITRIPVLTTNNEIVNNDIYIKIFKQIKEICTKE